MNSLIRISLFCFFLCFSSYLGAQNDPVLFSVADEDVHLSEFEYIYNKNNNDKANYSKESLEEYLDLYVKFKLKVAKAKDMGLDTVPRLQKELAGYRKKLADSYLSDKEVSEKLFDEAYERMQTDVKVSHILVKVSQNSAANTEEAAKRKANSIKEQISKGASFEEMAKSMSDDKSSASNNGMLGYFTAMLPSGFYEFESAMYNTKVGEVSEVVKSNLGFHILKVHDRRPARGEMEVAHLLIRNKVKGVEVKNAKPKADSLYKVIANGGNWESLVQQYSQDKNTLKKGGNLGYFGINQYDKSFEDAAFALEKNGDITEPIETKIGYHVIKRINKRDLSNKAEVKRRLQSKIQKSPRAKIGKDVLIEKIQKDGNFKTNAKVLDAFVNQLDKEFYGYKWKAPMVKAETILSFDGMESSNLDFAQYCQKNSRKRLRFDKKKPASEAGRAMFEDYIREQTLAYEESNLEKKYPDFKALMREYSEGILLFEVTKMEVWDKASLDTVGLKKFYDGHRLNYLWKPRARLERYQVKTDDEKLAKKVRKEAKKKTTSEVLEKFNKDETIVSYQTDLFEEGSKQLSKLKWKEGEQTDLEFDKRAKTYKFSVIRKVMPESQKTLAEAKGYVIADYQDDLERKWISVLKEDYEVKINDKVFNSMIK